MPCRALPTLVAVAALVAARAAHAGGFELVEQSPEAVATAGAQTADASAPAAVYYNPAALAFQRGVTAQAGASLVVYRGTARTRIDALPPTPVPLRSTASSASLPPPSMVARR